MFTQDPFSPKASVPMQVGAETEPDVAKPVAHESGVPKGTTKEILEWVGDDKDRAQQALDAEEADDSPRKTLVHDLNKKLDED